MRRRDLLLATGLAAAVSSAALAAEPAAKQRRLALAHPSLPAPGWRERPLFQTILAELRGLGYAEGQNLTVEYFSAEGHIDRYPELAQAVVNWKPDVVVTLGDLVPALRSATGTIPIVAQMGDPVLLGYVTNLARPGGNLTGVSIYAGFEVAGKRLELLKEAFPATSRVAVINTQAQGPDAAWRPQLREYAAKLGLSLIETVLRDATTPEIERGFAELAQQRPDAIVVGAEAALPPRAGLIVRLAEQYRWPAIYPISVFTEAGGLMAYAFDPAELTRQTAEDVRRILDGADPGDIPIYQPTRFKLILNLKAAKALGLALPQGLLARADEVIE